MILVNIFYVDILLKPGRFSIHIRTMGYKRKSEQIGTNGGLDRSCQPKNTLRAAISRLRKSPREDWRYGRNFFDAASFSGR